MAQQGESVEHIRAQYEAEIMTVDGVVGVSSGVADDGTPCLTIYVSADEDAVRSKLPKAIFDVCVKIDNVGEIKTQ